MEKKITVSRKKVKKLTVSRKKAKILTVNRKSHYPIETLYLEQVIRVSDNYDVLKEINITQWIARDVMHCNIAYYKKLIL